MAALTDNRTIALTHFTVSNRDEKPLLRISTAGSVDDGKSTLIGRLLFDTKTVWEDNLEEISKSKVNRASHGLDLSLLTDGLRAEREQGITIDVAYRYFSTPKRQFIVADTPGHEQYTRNMATGASTCDLAIILLDARKGVLEQSRRHSRIAWLLGVRHLVFAVNKMDLVDFSHEVFDDIRAHATHLLSGMDGVIADFIPLSALDGDNVVTRSERTPWYKGPSLLELLETVDPPHVAAAQPFRMSVQMVIRPHLDFRGYAGQLASGWIRVGDPIVALPSGKRSRVKRIVTFDGDLTEAFAPMSITLELEDELDIARGDLLASPATAPKVARRLHTTLVWMSEEPLDKQKTYLLQHGTRVVPARLNGESLSLNGIGPVEVETAELLPYDTYRDNRSTGGFILIDTITNLTLASGLIEGEVREEEETLESFSDAPFTPAERRKLRALLAHMKRFGFSFDHEDFEQGEGI
jgi:sulfate adenylyltransferase large subunit